MRTEMADNLGKTAAATLLGSALINLIRFTFGWVFSAAVGVPSGPVVSASMFGSMVRLRAVWRRRIAGVVGCTLSDDDTAGCERGGGLVAGGIATSGTAATGTSERAVRLRAGALNCPRHPCGSNSEVFFMANADTILQKKMCKH